jgi:hypothetical protein
MEPEYLSGFYYSMAFFGNVIIFGKILYQIWTKNDELCIIWIKLPDKFEKNEQLRIFYQRGA